MDGVRDIVVVGTVYRCPFSARFVRHTPAERSLMAESVGANGVCVPVKLYDDTTAGLTNAVLDGEGRLEACAAAGTEPAVEHLGSMTTDQAYELAKVFNDHRRQDTPEAVQARRTERLERVAEKRAEGKSIRTIATEEGVSRTQVERDLATAKPGVPGGTPEPEKITGKDGKQQAAKKKTKPKAEGPAKPESNKPAPRGSFDFGENVTGNDVSARPAAEPAAPIKQPDWLLKPVLSEKPKKPKDGDRWPAASAVNADASKYYPTVVQVGSGEGVFDAYGQAVPKGTADYFNDPRFRGLHDEAARVAGEAEALYRRIDTLKGKVGKSYPWASMSDVMTAGEKMRAAAADMLHVLADAMPYLICPDCHGHVRGCKSCRTSGYWPVSHCDANHDRLPPAPRPAPKE